MMSTHWLFLITLLREQRGAVTMTYLLCFPVILLALLGSIDFIRYSMAQDKLQNSLDAAVISAGRNLDKFTPDKGSDDETKWRTDASRYFRSNMPENFLGSHIPLENLKITYGTENNEQGAISGQLVRMSVSGTLPLLSTGMMERTAFTLMATNEAVRRTRSDVEMVLALDNTGSMGHEDRIGKLKIAATKLVDTLLSAAQAGKVASQSFIGVVPFADTVYVGQEKVHWLSPRAQQMRYIEAGKHWGGCLVEPYVNNTFEAKPGLPGNFEPLMTVGTKEIDMKKVENVPYYEIDGNSLEISGQDIDKRINDPDLKNNHTIRVSFAFNSYHRQWQYGDTGWLNNCLSDRKMIFLSNNAPDLKRKINAMEIGGRTIIPLGLLWSWRMLDADWRGADGWGDSNKPRDPAIGLKKVIVLLTDGNNGLDPVVGTTVPFKLKDVGVIIDGENDGEKSVNLSFKYRLNKGDAWSKRYLPLKISDDSNFLNRFYANSSDFNSLRIGSPDELKAGGTENGTKINPFGLLFQKPSGNDSDWLVGNNTLNTLTTKLCENIKNEYQEKNKNIEIYTVVLGSGTNDRTKSMMQNCSSGTGNYFDASNVDHLSSAFQSIASSLTELRLNK